MGWWIHFVIYNINIDLDHYYDALRPKIILVSIFEWYIHYVANNVIIDLDYDYDSLLLWVIPTWWKTLRYFWCHTLETHKKFYFWLFNKSLIVPFKKLFLFPKFLPFLGSIKFDSKLFQTSSSDKRRNHDFPKKQKNPLKHPK